MKTILFSDHQDPRIHEAAEQLAQEGEINPLVYGQDGFSDDDKKEAYNKLIQNPKYKELSYEDFLTDSLVYCMTMLDSGLVDGVVSGSTVPSKPVLVTGIRVLGLKDNLLSSAFLMKLKDSKKVVFGDCAVLPDPSSEQLAQISIDCAKTYNKMTGKKPVVGLLSFSSVGSANTPETQKIIKAKELIEAIDPELTVYGELQFDAAFDLGIGQSKTGGEMTEEVNTFIFPNLDAGNIGYKIAQHIGGADAIGPILQGLNKPLNDLSRGCKVSDIVDLSYITAGIYNR